MVWVVDHETVRKRESGQDSLIACGGEVTEYEWDYRNRLVKVTEKNGQGTVTQVVEYVYDLFDRRIGRKLDTTTPFDMANAAIERYVLDDIHNGLMSADGGNVVLDFVDPDGSGARPLALAKRYLYGEAVDQLLAQEDLSKTLGDAARNLWPLVDHLGTVRDLAKQDSTIVPISYDASSQNLVFRPEGTALSKPRAQARRAVRAWPQPWEASPPLCPSRA